MKEISFLNKNSAKWKKFESFIDERNRQDIDQIADTFIQLTDDLSYAKTFYPESKTVSYLNQLTVRTHQVIYRNKKEKRGRIASFWKTELPLVVRENHRFLLYSFLITLVSFLIGAISTANDDSFVRLILGDRYVDMTLANIDKGDPMAVFKQMNGVEMFLGISFNNIKVSFFAFISGITLSFGTWYVLFGNGVMLGTFLCFFYEKGLLDQAMLAIWIHGTLEISAIIIAGGAGIAMGNSLLFPGTYKRLTLFMKSARDGLKIVIGLVPVFLVAATLEGFVTRYTNMPLWLKLSIILASLVFIVWYFILYPLILSKKLNYDTGSFEL